MRIEPYLFFGGHCAEAIALYRDALGAEVTGLMHFRDNPEPPPPGALPEGWEDKVMHAALRIGDSTVMVSDGNCPGGDASDRTSLVIHAPDAASARRMFEALADGGEVRMPLGETFFSPLFGALVDRFGVGWMVIVPGDPASGGAEPGESTR